MKNIFITAIMLVTAVVFTFAAFYTGEKYTTGREINLSAAGARTVVLDAGHGEPDGGASSDFGVSEQAINLAIVKKTELFFTFAGISNELTRKNEYSIHSSGADTIHKKKVSDIQNRISFTKSVRNPIFVSVHLNYFEQKKYRGAQTFYNKSAGSKELAQFIQNRFISVLKDDNSREIKPAPDGVYIMKKLTCPAVIAECGFLSNDAEAMLLCDSNYQDKLAFSLFAGTIEYMTKE